MDNQINQIQPFQQFFNKMNKDLSGWLKNEQSIFQLLQDYKNTLRWLQEESESEKVMVDLGERCLIKAKRLNNKIIIRCKEDIYVQFTKDEALTILRSLIDLYDSKLNTCKTQISKIMTSMRQMQQLIVQYQTIA